MSALQTLMEMGFSENASKKALAVAGGGGIEQAMEWLLAHADDPTINDEPAHAEEPGKAVGSEPADGAPKETGDGEDVTMEDKTDEEQAPKSIKCDDCGKLFRTTEEVEYHAVKSGHENFSESTEEKKPLTEEEKEQKRKEMSEKIKLRRREREEQEQEEARERERKRIQMGKDIAERKRLMQEMEIKKLAEERRRDKMEDKLARQKIKEQIERDRQAKKDQMANKTDAEAKPAPPQAQPAAVAAAASSAQPAQKKEYTTTRLQIRLPSGTPLVQEFKAKESLSAVRLWIGINRTDGMPPDAPFKLSMTFPRKTFTDEDMEKPLDTLGLVPSAVLMVS